MKTIKRLIAFLLCLFRRPIVLVGHVTGSSAKIFVYGDEPKVINRGLKSVVTKLRGDAYLVEMVDLYPNVGYSIEIGVGPFTRFANFRTDTNELSDTSFMFGSCNLHSIWPISSPEGPYKKLNEIADHHNAGLMLHLGDQIYSDIPNPLFIPTYNHYRRKYIDAWSNCKSANAFLSRVSNIMILDDHELTNNYNNKPHNKHRYNKGIEAYKVFQHSHNPKREIPELKDHEVFHFSFTRNEHPFFVMDSRISRDVRKGFMIDQFQEFDLYAWLLKNKHKPFKFIVSPSPFLFVSRDLRDDGWCQKNVIAQRNRIMRFILDNNIDNCVFLSGDTHCGGVSMATLLDKDSGKTITFHEIMSSPINQIQMGRVDNYERLTITDENDQDMCCYIFSQKPLIRRCNVCAIDISHNKLKWTFYDTKSKTGKDVIKSGEITSK